MTQDFILYSKLGIDGDMVRRCPDFIFYSKLGIYGDKLS